MWRIQILLRLPDLTAGKVRHEYAAVPRTQHNYLQDAAPGQAVYLSRKPLTEPTSARAAAVRWLTPQPSQYHNGQAGPTGNGDHLPLMDWAGIGSPGRRPHWAQDVPPAWGGIRPHRGAGVGCWLAVCWDGCRCCGFPGPAWCALGGQGVWGWLVAGAGAGLLVASVALWVRQAAAAIHTVQAISTAEAMLLPEGSPREAWMGSSRARSVPWPRTSSRHVRRLR